MMGSPPKVKLEYERLTTEHEQAVDAREKVGQKKRLGLMGPSPSPSHCQQTLVGHERLMAPPNWDRYKL